MPRQRFLVVILNGPPHSGKDTIISRLMQATTPYMILNHKHIMGWHEKMIMPLKDMVCGLFNLSGYQYETMKDDPILPNHVTPREAIMHLDRHWARPLFGEDFLGNLLVKELEQNHRKSRPYEFKDQINIHFVDAGVEPEVWALRDAYGSRVKVLHIHRTGAEFTDSRAYLSQHDGVIFNDDGQINKTVDSVLLFINKWLEELDDQINAGITTGVPKEGEISKSQS